MNMYEVIRRPLTTEKTYSLRAANAYAFEVHHDATKHEVKQAVEKIFDVSVLSVNVINVPAKRRRAGRRWIVRQQPRRKAVVRLARWADDPCPGYRVVAAARAIEESGRCQSRCTSPHHRDAGA